jgi:hypothetical protein
MHRRTILPLATALALAGLIPRSAGAQRPGYGPTIALTLADSAMPVRVALKSAYRVRLTSTWPQQVMAGGCRNGGHETIEGTLTRTASGGYVGTFARRTELRFCGAHGGHEAAAAANCELVLTGQGDVGATGVVRRDPTGPTGHEVRLVWTPVEGHRVAVGGACAPAFKEAMKRMYLTTPHAAEFALPSAGTGPRTERLENYAWAVELE